jgi:hypothetical protein
MKENLIKGNSVHFDGLGCFKIKASTEKAILIEVNLGYALNKFKPVWLPISCIDINRISKEDNIVAFCYDLPNWLNKKLIVK